MPSITLKNVPPSLLEKLRERARRERRSLTQEALVLLERALETSPVTPLPWIDAESQVRRWRELSGRWEHDGSTEDLVREIFEHRSLGREVDL